MHNSLQQYLTTDSNRDSSVSRCKSFSWLCLECRKLLGCCRVRCFSNHLQSYQKLASRMRVPSRIQTCHQCRRIELHRIVCSKDRPCIWFGRGCSRNCLSCHSRSCRISTTFRISKRTYHNARLAQSKI